MSTQLTIIQPAHQVDPIALILNAKLGDATKDKYVRVLGAYLDTGGDILDAIALETFARELGNSRKAHLRAAVRIYTKKLQYLTNASANPMAENVQEVEAKMAQADRLYKSLGDAIQVEEPKGEKAHTWLSQAEVRQLYQATNGGIEGERDRVALGLMVAAGLRAQEAVTLTFDDIILDPVEDKIRTVLNVLGKGKKNRGVPVSDHLANLIDVWGRRIGHQGRIIRALGRNLEPDGSMSGVGLFKLVRRYGERIGKPDLAPHDLRRTFAQIGYESGVPITQISVLLGHANVATTQRYLNLKLDLKTTASDFIAWH